MLALYGHKLIAMHLNDNLGVYDVEGEISPRMIFTFCRLTVLTIGAVLPGDSMSMALMG